MGCPVLPQETMGGCPRGSAASATGRDNGDVASADTISPAARSGRVVVWGEVPCTRNAKAPMHMPRPANNANTYTSIFLMRSTDVLLGAKRHQGFLRIIRLLIRLSASEIAVENVVPVRVDSIIFAKICALAISLGSYHVLARSADS